MEIENYNPYHIQASIVNGQLYIVPTLNWFGVTPLIISANDGFSKIYKNIYLEALPVNDAPIFTEQIITTDINEDSPLSNYELSDNGFSYEDYVSEEVLVDF